MSEFRRSKHQSSRAGKGTFNTLETSLDICVYICLYVYIYIHIYTHTFMLYEILYSVHQFHRTVQLSLNILLRVLATPVPNLDLEFRYTNLSFYLVSWICTQKSWDSILNGPYQLPSIFQFVFQYNPIIQHSIVLTNSTFFK
jgi:hypothetical protein